jgi:hypothetical protein
VTQREDEKINIEVHRTAIFVAGYNNNILKVYRTVIFVAGYNNNILKVQSTIIFVARI